MGPVKQLSVMDSYKKWGEKKKVTLDISFKDTVDGREKHLGHFKILLRVLYIRNFT